MGNDFTINELVEIKTVLVKAQRFDLAAKVRDMEKSHPDYVPPKKKRGRPSKKNNWIISVEYKNAYIKKYGVDEYNKLSFLINVVPPKGKLLNPQQL